MLPKKKKIKKEVKQAIQIEEADKKVRTIGYYYPIQKVFKCNRSKAEHYMRKLDAWGLDANTVKFLIKQGATVEIKDTDSNWSFSCKASDFLLYGTVEEHLTHRPQYFLNVKKWTTVKATHKTLVLRCGAVCKHNFCGNCIMGVIELNGKGECANFE